MKRPAKGEHWQDNDGTVRVMAVVEGYVVARRRGASPFLLSVREFEAAFERVQAKEAKGATA